jgi:hypothetical protein
MEVSDQLQALAALPPGKHSRYPFDRRLGGLQFWSERCGKEKNNAPVGNVTRAVQPVAIPTLYSLIILQFNAV